MNENKNNRHGWQRKNGWHATWRHSFSLVEKKRLANIRVSKGFTLISAKDIHLQKARKGERVGVAFME